MDLHRHLKMAVRAPIRDTFVEVGAHDPRNLAIKGSEGWVLSRYEVSRENWVN